MALKKSRYSLLSVYICVVMTIKINIVTLFHVLADRLLNLWSG